MHPTLLFLVSALLAASASASNGRELVAAKTSRTAEIRVEAGRKVVYVDGARARELLEGLSRGIREIGGRIGDLESNLSADRARLAELRAALKSLHEERQRLEDLMERALTEGGAAGADSGDSSAAKSRSSGEAGPPGGGDGGAGAPGGKADGRGLAAGEATANAFRIADRLRGALGGPAGLLQPGSFGAEGLRDALAERGPALGADGARAWGVAGFSVPSGHRVVYDKLGLTMGAGPDGLPSLRRKDGAPASAQDAAALRQALSREPQALIRRPDFFDVLARRDFERLKRAHDRRPALRETLFKDIRSAGSDLVWSRTCAAVSGEYNEGFEELIQLLEEEGASDKAQGTGASPRAAGRTLAHAREAIEKGLLTRALGWLGLAAQDETPPSPGADEAAPAKQGEARPLSSGRGPGGAALAPRSPAQAGARTPAGVPGARGKRLWIWLPFALAGIGLIYLGMRGKRS